MKHVFDVGQKVWRATVFNEQAEVMMKTIEERARQYATKIVGGEYVGGFKGDMWLASYERYIEIATEQEEIAKQDTIARTCEWMRNHNTGEEVIEQYVKDMEE